MTFLLGVCLVVAVGAVVALLDPRQNVLPTERKIEGPEQADRDASARLVSLIDVVFALVLGLPVVASEDVVRAPWHSNAPMLMSLFIAYYVVIRSYVDWHIAMEDGPYWIRTSERKAWELRRVYLDFAIVMAYVMLFLATTPLEKHAGAEISAFLLLLAVIIALYMLWGVLRWYAYRQQHEYRSRTLVSACVGFVATWGAYKLERHHVHALAHHNVALNILALSLAYVVLAAYRLRNWREIRHVRQLVVSAPEAVA